MVYEKIYLSKYNILQSAVYDFSHLIDMLSKLYHVSHESVRTFFFFYKCE